MLNTDLNVTSKYRTVIDNTQRSLEKIENSNMSIPKDSWIYDALKHAQIVEQHSRNNSLENFTSNNEIKWKTTIVFGNLSEFNLIMAQSDKLQKTSKAVFEKKLKEIVKMPLRVIDENAKTGTNQGRNTLFELRLAARFAQSGYKPILSHDHPDILINTEGKEYVIECKRVYSERSFTRLVCEAIDQLTNNSLQSDPNRLGVVAISISRAFHKGDKKLSSTQANLLSEFVDKEVEKFIKKHSDYINRVFPKNIPLLVLDFSDFAEIDKPYWVNFLYLVGTAKNLQQSLIQSVFKDLENFRSFNE